MTNIRTELQKAVSRLATGPGYAEWNDFMEAFQLYVIDLKDQCVQAPADRLQISQGHAQQGVFLRDLFVAAAAKK